MATLPSLAGPANAANAEVKAPRPGLVRRLQYAELHLQTPLFVMLGYTNCGAISAALDTQVRGQRHHSRIQILVDAILPALHELDPHLSPEVLLALAVEANVRWSMHRIRESPEGRERLAEGRMKLIGAIYEIETGRVRFLDEAPDQTAVRTA